MKKTGKFLNKAAEAYNGAYKKMKTGGSTKKKYQIYGSTEDNMKTAGPGTPKSSIMPPQTRSQKVMGRAQKNWQRAENIRKDVKGRNPNDYEIANRLYKKAARQENRAKRIASRGR
jgi:hypothetical protein